MARQAFDRFAGTAAIGVAVGGIAYSAAFVVAVKAPSETALTVSWVLLFLGGLLGTAVVVAVYRRVRDVDPGFALWGILLGAVGTIGSAAHAGFEVAIAVQPVARNALLPNPLDPRGIMTFGLTGLGVMVLSWLIRRERTLPANLGTLGVVLGLLMILVYLGRLLIIDPTNPALLGIAGITGLIAHPWWFFWLGRSLLR
ncbi:MAG TPA: hypothetical protein VG602_03535 [Actinomycetota bacterium]|nr:hypothetical protein [Actinomycetota bacterium]